MTERTPSEEDARICAAGLIAMSQQGRWHELTDPEPDDAGMDAEE